MYNDLSTLKLLNIILITGVIYGFIFNSVVFLSKKRKGKPITIIEGYNGATSDFKILAKEIKTKLSVGGSFKDDKIIIQGDFRDKIMDMLKDKGFKVKRVGG